LRTEEEQSAEGLKQRFTQRYSRHGSKLDRAIRTALDRSVKEHLFLPSKRRVYTVVGNLGDEFIDPEKPYCSCSNFFFRGLGQKGEPCYHLLSYVIASESGLIDSTTFSDEEYELLMTALVDDVFHILDTSGSSPGRI